MIEAEQIFRSETELRLMMFLEPFTNILKKVKFLKTQRNRSIFYSQIRKLKEKAFVERLVEYQQNLPKAVEAIRRGDFNLYAPSTDSYLEKVRLYQE